MHALMRPGTLRLTRKSIYRISDRNVILLFYHYRSYCNVIVYLSLAVVIKTTALIIISILYIFSVRFDGDGVHSYERSVWSDGRSLSRKVGLSRRSAVQRPVKGIATHFDSAYAVSRTVCWGTEFSFLCSRNEYFIVGSSFKKKQFFALLRPI